MDQLVTQLVKEAGADLSAALAVYWPTEGNNEMPEAQALGALGRAFGRAGFHVFHEVRCGAKGHVDLVAICTARSACVAIEGKRLYNDQQAAEMLRDWRRLGTKSLATQYGSPKVTHHFRALVATTWDSRIKEWWEGSADAPSGLGGSSWKQLRDETVDAHRPPPSPIQQCQAWGKQWLLVAAKRRPTPFFAPHG